MNTLSINSLSAQVMMKAIRLFFIISCFALISFTLGDTVASAQTDTFTAGSGLWSVPGNWSLDQLPGSGNDCVMPGGSTVTADTGGTCNNFSVGSGSFITVTPGYVFMYGSSLINNGSIMVGNGDGLGLEGQGTTVTLSGSGTVTLTTASASFHGTSGSSPILINQQTIQGQGSLGLEGLSIVNQSTIDASGGTLTVQTDSAGITNTSLMEASNGATLWIVAPVGNTGGTIEALSGGIVILDGNVTGGKLTTVGTGVIQATSDSILNGLTNSGMVQVSDNTALLQGTVTNSGTFQVQNSGTLFMSGNVTLTGSGSVILSGNGQLEKNLSSVGIPGGSLTNQQLIHGAGTFYDLPLTNQAAIEADSTAGPLYLETATTNTGTLEASGGASLVLYTGQTVSNAGGTIEALAGSTVVLEGTVSGGTLSTTGTGVIESENGTLDGTVNVPTNSGTLTTSGGYDLTMQGTINNTGTIAMTGNGCVYAAQPTTLTGTGKLTLGGSNCIYGSGNAFINQSTIEGGGSIGDSNPMPITNDGTILANNKKFHLMISPNSAGFTNNGTLTADKGCTLIINSSVNNPFNSLSAGTLTSGVYNVTGTLELGGSITTNAATITLTGAPAEIYNSSSGTNALAGLTANATTGVLSLLSGQVLATTTSVSNSGKMTVALKSGFTVGGTYTQAAGTTTVDGALTASSGLIAQGGTLLGKGTLASAVASSGTITVGDSTTKPGVLTVAGTYTQNEGGTLNIPITGSTLGSQYSQLAVSNGVSLGGALTIQRKKSFTPAIGDTFTILTGSAVTGQFATVNGSSINGGEHFEISYTPTAVMLTVVSGV
jgi:fibronectin-binding autotransporter adhesin